MLVLKDTACKYFYKIEFVYSCIHSYNFLQRDMMLIHIFYNKIWC